MIIDTYQGFAFLSLTAVPFLLFPLLVAVAIINLLSINNWPFVSLAANLTLVASALVGLQELGFCIYRMAIAFDQILLPRGIVEVSIIAAMLSWPLLLAAAAFLLTRMSWIRIHAARIHTNSSLNLVNIEQFN